MMISTPIEAYEVDGHPIFVKREDLSAPAPAPPFSKVRGLVQHLTKLRGEGIQVIGYTETAISMAGWGVAWACKELGMKAIIFDPIYKEPIDVLLFHRSKWREMGAEIYPIKAGMARVNWNISRKLLRDLYGPGAVLLPLGLPLKESIESTKDEALSTLKNIKAQSIVVNVGSGTIAAGVYKGAVAARSNLIIYGVMGRTGSVIKKMSIIERKAEELGAGLFRSSVIFKLIDPGWEYMDKSKVECPFPCHPYYDLKAWEWLIHNVKQIKAPILFWNIGSGPLN